jgi:HlyD family secretion protein
MNNLPPAARVKPVPADTAAAATTAPPAPAAADATDLKTLLAEPAAQRWYRRPLLWSAILLLILLAAGLWYWEKRQADNAAPSYSTQTVGRGNLTLSVTANGTLQPTRTINIGSELSGTVLKVNVDVNDRLTKGQVLVELDPSKLNDQILRSRAALTAAKALVGQTAATVKEAQSSLARLEEVARLSDGKVPSKAELDSGRATQERALADDSSARAGVASALAALSTDEINLAKASIRAPANGVVLTRSVEPGNAVAASLQAVTLFSVAEDLAELRLQVYVDEADVGSVQVEQKASFTVSAYPSRQYPAQITRVAFGSTITDNVVTYLTYLGVNNADLTLRPGMTATATIIADQRNDVLLVPNTALRFTPGNASNEASKAAGGIAASLIPRGPSRNAKKSASANASTAAARQVWVLRDEVAVAVAVMPGISDGRMTEIVSGDLVAGMLVITDQKTAAAK